MAASDTDPTPVLVNRDPTKWQEYRGVVIFAMFVLASSVGFWHSSGIQPVVPLILLGIGLFFDIISIIARISTAITGRYSSGVFLIGFVFYFWAWISFPQPVFLGEANGLLSLWLRKIPDILVMAAFHLAIHVSFGLDGARPEAKAEPGAAGQPATRPSSK